MAVPDTASWPARRLLRLIGLALLQVLWVVPTRAQSPEGWRWGKDLNGSAYDAIRDVAQDSTSNATYAVGTVEKGSGGIIADLLNAVLNLLFGAQYGGLDGAILKYGPNGGDPAWGILIGGTGDDVCTGVCVGSNGNLYVTGYFSGNNATFGSGPTLSSAGGKDLFVASYDPNGNLLWKVRAGGTGDEVGTGIAFRNGTLFVSGTFKGTPTIAGAASTAGLSTTRTNTFIAAFRASDGAGLWRVDGGNANDSELNAICVDDTRVYAIGRFQGTSYQAYTTAGAVGAALTTPAGRTNNGFVTAVRQDGIFAWSAAISDAAGSDGNYNARGIGATATGVFITGSSHNGTLFPGNLTVNAAGNPHDYAYVARLNKSTGATTWVRTMRATNGGNDHSQVGRDLTVDRNGDVLITGSFRSNIQFPNGLLLSGTSDLQVFAAKYGGTGLFKWGIAAPGNHDDLANAISTDGSGHVSVGGMWQDEILFSTELDAGGDENIFVAQLTDLNYQVASYRDPSRWNAFGPLCQTSPPIDLTTTYIPVQAGSGISVQSSSGLATPEGALGLDPGGSALFDSNGDRITIDFGNTIPANELVLMRWNRVSGATNANAQIEVSSDASTFVDAGLFQTTSTTPGFTPITVPVATRYLRITRAAASANFSVSGVFDDLGTEPDGSWSGAGVTGTTFDPAGLAGSIPLTYTVGTRSTTRSISVSAVSVAGTIGGDTALCPNGSTTLTLTGNAGTTITWSTSTDGGTNWASTTTNDGTFTLANVTQPTQVRATVTSGACPAATSDLLTVDPRDTVAPVLDGCPGNITMNALTGECRNTVSYALPTATDDCSGPVTVQPVDPATVSGGTFYVGATPVVLRATDANGNSATCSFTVTIVDADAPVITCPGDVTANATAGLCGGTVDYAPPTATDNCSGTVAVVPEDLLLAPNSFFPLGTTTVPFRATDLAGNSSTCSFHVTVVDAEAPVIACPADLIVDAAPGACGRTVNYTLPTATDNCNAPVTVAPVDPALGPNGFFSLGTTTVTLRATDAAGNSSTCAFSITVKDTEAPAIACPPDLVVDATPGACGRTVNYTLPTATDNCNAPVTVAPVDPMLGPNGFFSLGTTTVTLRAIDAAGNSSTCAFTITVKDTEAPTITCPADITVGATPGTCGRVVSYASAVATDNCPGTVAALPADPLLLSGSLFSLGTTPVTLRAVDAAGNSSTCTFHVQVVDAEPPAITCPGDITTNALPGACSAPVTFATPTTIDNCNGAVSLVPLGPASGSDFPVGTTEVRFDATDAAGNSGSCTFHVTVIDAEAPVIDGCTDVTVQVNDPHACGAVVMHPVVTATDNCGGAVVPVHASGPASGSFVPFGDPSVTYTATYGGLTSSCAFHVSVVDKAPPVFTLAAAPVLALGADCSAPMPDLGTLLSGATDCSGVGAITQTPAIGSLLSTNTTASLRISDALGNDTTVQVTVIVEDQTPPSITCPDPISVTLPLGQCSTQVAIPRPTLSDNCSIVALTDSSGIPPGPWFAEGSHFVTYTATDGAGHASTCPLSITVLPQPAIAMAYAASTFCSDADPVMPATLQPTGGMFACSTAGLTLDATTGEVDPATSTPGTYTVTYGFAGPCASEVPFTLTIERRPDAGADGSLTLCSADAPADLFATLAGTPDAGGSWSGPGPTIGLFDPATMDPGSYTYTVSGGVVCAFSSATVAVSVTPEADASFTYAAGAFCASDAAPVPTVAEPGGVFSADSDLAIDPASGIVDLVTSSPGDHAIRYILGGSCPDTATFLLHIDAPAIADAGDDVQACGPAAVVNAVGDGSWSGPPGVTITPSNAAVADVMAAMTGTYTLTWTTVNGTCTASNTVTVVLDAPVNVDAGADQQICGLSTTLQAEGSGTWNAPAGITLSDAGDATSTATAAAAGTYILERVLVNGSCADTASMTITFDEPVTADAGAAHAVCGLQASLEATVPSVGEGTWSGPSEIAFLDVHDPHTAITASAPGTYTLTWTVVNATCTASDVTDIAFDAPVTADAGDDQQVCGLEAILTATGSGVWTLPAAVHADDDHLGTTTVLADVPDTYTLIWTVTNGACVNTDEMVVRFDAVPTVDPGADVDVCGTSGVLGATGTGVWSGPAGITFGDASDPASTITAATPGTYSLQWTVTNGTCVRQGSVSATFTLPPDAGSDDAVTLCSDADAVSLSDQLTGAQPGGAWTAPDGSSHTGLFSPSTDAAGTYTYTVAGAGACPADQATVSVAVVSAPDPGMDGTLTLCSNGTPASLFDALNGTPGSGGSWTAPDSAPFSGILDPAADAPGLYTYTIAATAPCVDAGAHVQIGITAAPDASWTSPAPLCSASGPIDLSTWVTGAAGGTWNGTGVSGHVFDPDGLSGEQLLAYSVTADGCTATVSRPVQVVASPIADAGADASVCALDHTLQAVATVGSGQWSSPDDAVFAPQPTDPHAVAHVTTPGEHLFIWTVTNGQCSDADTVRVILHAAEELTLVDAGPDRTQNINTTCVLAGVADGATATQWSIIGGAGIIEDAGDLSTMVRGLGIGANTFVLGAQVGVCPLRVDTVTVTVNDLFIPTGFSPNGDGVNDLFEVTGLDVFTDNRFTVFNRWGQVVYSATGYANQWDGRGDNGQELMDDTYYYVLQLAEESVHNGYLILKR